MGSPGAHWSPAGALLAALEAGGATGLPRVDELPLDVRRQLASVLASRLAHLAHAAGASALPLADGRVDARGVVRPLPDHPGARLQAAAQDDPLASALLRYLHGGAGVSLSGLAATAGRAGAGLPVQAADAADAKRIPGHPFIDPGHGSAERVVGMRGLAWTAAAALVLLLALLGVVGLV
ncbi:hypothetical protein [Lysobacter sp. A3-1-A15]|uniref:hypothetical protein n=1 Tax=Novilysobacter viscosus TaxID=3098602 RepID=UPI002EDB5410